MIQVLYIILLLILILLISGCVLFLLLSGIRFFRAGQNSQKIRAATRYLWYANFLAGFLCLLLVGISILNSLLHLLNKMW